MLKHLNNLFMNPVMAWKEIDKSYYPSPLKLISNNLGVFVIINPLISFVLHLFFFESFKNLILDGFLIPLILTLISFFLIILLGLLLEEIYRIVSFKDPQLNIFKLLVFSSLPVYTLIAFYDFPFLGKILALTGIIYSIYLLKIGFEKFLWVNKSSRRNVFLIASLFSIGILIILAGIILIILDTIKDFLLRVIF